MVYEEMKFARPLFTPIRLDLQFFSEGGDGGEGGEGGSNEGGDGGAGGDDLDNPSLDELLKDPEFKKQYQAKFESALTNRLKKYDGVDPDEYKKLKAEADKKKRESETDAERLQRERDEFANKIGQVEKTEKRVAVKEYAIDNGLNPKLVSRLMEVELDSLKRNDGGEFEGISDAIDKLAEEFPEIKAVQESDEHEGDDDKETNRRYTAGGGSKMNPKKKPDRYSRGAELAKRRHQKQN